MSPNTILLTELSTYGTVFQTLLSQPLVIIIIIIIIIIRFHGLSKHSAFIAQLVAVHEFVQSVLEDLQ